MQKNCFIILTRWLMIFLAYSTRETTNLTSFKIRNSAQLMTMSIWELAKSKKTPFSISTQRNSKKKTFLVNTLIGSCKDGIFYRVSPGNPFTSGSAMWTWCIWWCSRFSTLSYSGTLATNLHTTLPPFSVASESCCTWNKNMDTLNECRGEMKKKTRFSWFLFWTL